MKAYRASGKDSGVTRDTPRAAALAFFEAFPNKRKCDVIAGESDGHFFTVAFGIRYSACGMPQSWKDVTKKTAKELPE